MERFSVALLKKTEATTALVGHDLRRQSNEPVYQIITHFAQIY